MRTCASTIACLLLLAFPALAANPDLPIEGLEQRVEFWKKIFTEYGANDLVIHDRFHVNLIYDVATDSDVQARLAAVRSALEEIRSNLETPENLSPAAQQIQAAIAGQGLQVSVEVLDKLSANIHTQRGIKERFRDGVVRSGRYVERFREIVQRHGVPVELALLPLVESSFQNVRSNAGAVGIWQFTRSTGRLYMTVRGRIDDRLDPYKAADAAARLLRDNYRALGSWPLAITAYNHGRGGMLQAKEAHGADINAIINEYDGPLFGYASMNFYAEFLAAVQVYDDYPSYFGELVLDRPDAPPAKAVVQTASAAKPKPAAASGEKYKVRRGDTLWDIAQRFGTSIRELMEKNNLSRPAIYAGQILLVK